MERVTETLVQFAAGLRGDALPPAAVEQTRLFMADYLAAGLAGYRINRSFNTAARYMLDCEASDGSSAVLLDKRRYPATDAAFLNAVYAHGADMDDGNRKAAGHIAAHVMSAVFALADTLEVSWGEVFAAIHVGYEFFNRIAGAAMPGLYNKGFHSTGVAGAVACGAACARLLGLDAAGIYNSVSLSAIQSGGLILIDESGQGCKPVNPANAAVIGIRSARLAQGGADASRNPLESGKGWFHAFTDQADEAELLEGLGSRFTMCESYLKLYPTCRHTHACIDAARQLRGRLTDPAAEIDRIEVFVYPAAIRSAGTIVMPRSRDEAKFSIAYALATALVTGGFTLEDLEPTGCDPAVPALAGRVTLIPDPSTEDRSKGLRGCRVELRLHSGATLEAAVPIPLGEGAGSLSFNEMEKKVIACARGLLDEDSAIQLVRQCREIRLTDRYETLFPLSATAERG